MKKSKMLWYFTALLLVFNIVMYLARWGGDTVLLIISDILPVVCGLVSAICLYIAFRGFKEFDFAKKAWMFIFAGITLDFFAEVIYGLLEIGYKVDMNNTFPSVADFFWCTGYIPLFIGLAMMFNGYRKSGFPLGNTKLYILLASVFIALFLLVTYFLLIPIIQDTETSALTKFFYMYYPIADIFVVVPAVILMYITSLFGKGTISRPWKYLAIGFICFTVADLLYSYLGWQDSYGSGNLIDLGWHLGYLLIGFAGLYQRELVESFKGRV